MQLEPATPITGEQTVRNTPSRFLLFAGPVLAGAISLALTMWTSHVISETELESANSRFDARVNSVQKAIVERMEAYEQVLRGGVGLFSASTQVDRAEWNTYVKQLGVREYYPGIQGIGFSKHVRPDDLDSHVQEIRSEGFPDYRLWPEGNRAVYTAIVFLEPFDFRNRRAFGFDMMSEPTRRAAMEQARDTGAAAVSGKVILKQETETDVQAGFLTYLPVYTNGQSTTTVEERRSALFGYVYSPFRMDDLMHGILDQDESALSLTVYDGKTASPDALTYSSGEANPSARFTRTISVDLTGRTWTLNIVSLPQFESTLPLGKSRVILISGALITLLVMIVAWLIGNTGARALRLAQDMTFALRESENKVQLLNSDLEQRVNERTSQLDAVNQELEAFAYSVSHDLRAPLRAMSGLSQALGEDYGDKLDETGKDYIGRIAIACKQMGNLIDDLLALSRITRTEIVRMEVNLSDVAETIAEELQDSAPGRNVEFKIQPNVVAHGDTTLLRTVLENLIGNSWKYSSKKPHATIEFGTTGADSQPTYFVRDDGAGFNMQYAEKLFKPFQRLHRATEFEGTGVGLASVANIVRRHGGRVWAESEQGRGTTMQFTL